MASGAPPAFSPRLPQRRRPASLGFRSVDGLLPSASTAPPACSPLIPLRHRPATLVFHSAAGRRAWMPSSEPPHRPAATLLQPPSGGTRRSKHVLRMAPPLAYSLRRARPSASCPVRPGDLGKHLNNRPICLLP